MKAEIESVISIEAKKLKVSAGVRYWEDAMVNGIEDEEGDLIPCRNGDYWEPEIDIDSGQILNWQKGTTANIHYKVCDDGKYHIYDGCDKLVLKKEYYVPKIMCPTANGYGDYIIMSVDENGFIQDWNPTFEEFNNVL